MSQPERVAEGEVPKISKKDAVDAPKPESPKELTPEEQMALFEKDLKENDWGHQPC